MTHSSRQITSTLRDDGQLVVELAETELPEPSGSQVLIRVEAAPINPSDLGLLFGPADLEQATFEDGRIICPMPEAAMRAMAARIGQVMPVGNEGAGTVIAAGEAPGAQALIGKRVACVPGGAYAEQVIADARMCMPLPDNLPIELGAASFVNPLTALGFVETMRAEGFTALVHTAAASNLGQMLVKLCAEDGIPLVNIVRSEEQVQLLKGLGAEHVVNSSDEGFMASLRVAIEATGARLGFDAIGGGTMASTILTAMEAVAARDMPYSRYGSSERKKVYVYGALDMGPTVLTRAFGFTWDVAGWLLLPFLAKLSAEDTMRLRGRVAQGLTSTFASHFKARVTLDEMLTRETALAYNAKATGAKYLVTPSDALK
ncbi:MAG TPA: zinc-binding dehydrogenase [Alteraurantiacibacter sp.]